MCFGDPVAPEIQVPDENDRETVTYTKNSRFKSFFKKKKVIHEEPLDSRPSIKSFRLSTDFFKTYVDNPEYGKNSTNINNDSTDSENSEEGDKTEATVDSNNDSDDETEKKKKKKRKKDKKSKKNKKKKKKNKQKDTESIYSESDISQILDNLRNSEIKETIEMDVIDERMMKQEDF